MFTKIVANLIAPPRILNFSKKTSTITRDNRLIDMQCRVVRRYIVPFYAANPTHKMQILDFGIGGKGAPTFFDLLRVLKSHKKPGSIGKYHLYGIDINEKVIKDAKFTVEK